MDVDTCQEVDSAVENAQNLEASFMWRPPTFPSLDADNLLADTKSISPDDVIIGFAALEELKRTEENCQTIDKVQVEVFEGNASDLIFGCYIYHPEAILAG
ncbi:hypothetical protein P692DRAFT_20825343 [Suillus brevipes Sb2]|nr:hypothetical protein P692DRAFT_20825343 [Suillus brevipes Sb2]